MGKKSTEVTAVKNLTTSIREYWDFMKGLTPCLNRKRGELCCGGNGQVTVIYHSTMSTTVQCAVYMVCCGAFKVCRVCVSRQSVQSEAPLQPSQTRGDRLLTFESPTPLQSEMSETLISLQLGRSSARARNWAHLSPIRRSKLRSEVVGFRQRFVIGVWMADSNWCGCLRRRSCWICNSNAARLLIWDWSFVAVARGEVPFRLPGRAIVRKLSISGSYFSCCCFFLASLWCL